MSQFFRFLFASCLGTLLAVGVLVLLGVVSLTRLATSLEGGQVDVKANSVLRLDAGIVPERTNNVPRSPFELDPDPVVGLYDLRRVLAKAAGDDDVKGVFLDVDDLAVGPATSLALRDALQEFKASGKFVVSHAKYYGQGAYFLASVADAVYLNPTGALDVRGYGTTIPFFTGLFDKLGVDVNVFYAGDFKSAGEPFFRRSMSDSNRLQTREYLEDLWGVWTREVAESRGVSQARVAEIGEEYLARDDDDALALGLVDGILYKDQVLDDLRERLGLDEDDDIPTVSAADYFAKLQRENVGKDRIAVVVAEGNIVDGPGELGVIGDAKYARLLRRIRRNDKTKAIVLRVNSGGGSAMASENIWRELQLAREQGIPVVTSMGDLAASGGYYIAAPSDSIFAEPNTLTGSIGVVGIVPNFSDLAREELGVTFDTVNTGEFSSAFSVVFPFSERERDIIQNAIEDTYDTFVLRVAEGRNLSVEQVRALAKGRVYTGQDALGLGLVDRLGGLDEAIAAAASLADLDLDDVRIKQYPEVKTPQEELIAELTGQGDDNGDIRVVDPLLRAELGGLYERYRGYRQLLEASGPQMVMLEELR